MLKCDVVTGKQIFTDSDCDRTPTPSTARCVYVHYDPSNFFSRDGRTLTHGPLESGHLDRFF